MSKKNKKKNKGWSRNQGNPNLKTSTMSKDNKKTTTTTKGSPSKFTKAVKKFPVTAIKKKGAILITQDLKDKIDYLHTVVGKTEWSGILSYKKQEGDFNKPEDLIFLAEDIIPMDVGTSTYTEYSMEDEDEYADPKIVQLMTNGNKMGHIHTHHDMDTFFSGTDTDELHENAPNHNYYLSLIVNFEDIEDWKCKVCYITKVKTSYELPTEGIQENEYETMVTIDLDVMPEIEIEPDIPADFIERVAELKKPKVTTTYGNYYGSRGSQLGFDWADWEYGDNVQQSNNYYTTKTEDKKDGKTAMSTTTSKSSGDLLEKYRLKSILNAAIKEHIKTGRTTYVLDDTMKEAEKVYLNTPNNTRIITTAKITGSIMKSLDTHSKNDDELFVYALGISELLEEDYQENSTLALDLICDITTEIHS